MNTIPRVPDRPTQNCGICTAVFSLVLFAFGVAVIWWGLG